MATVQLHFNSSVYVEEEETWAIIKMLVQDVIDKKSSLSNFINTMELERIPSWKAKIYFVIAKRELANA